MVDGVQLLLGDGLRLSLPVEIDRRDHVQPIIVEFVRVVALQLLDHRHDEMGRFNREGAGGELEFVALGGVGLGGGDVPVLRHQVEHLGLTVAGGVEVGQRIVDGGRLQQSGEQRALAQREIGRGLAEIGLRRRLDAVGEVAEIGLVEVERQHVGFAVGVLQPNGEDRLAQLAAQRALGALFGIEQQIARDLLGDGAAPGDDFAAGQVDHEGAGDADHVDAGMAVEVGVLGADDRLLARQRDGVERDGGVAPAGLRVGEDFI